MKILVAAVLGSVLAFHFGVTLLYNLPDNPVSRAAHPFVSSYMDPLFTQAWTFFAPTPPERDDFLLARFSCNADRRAKPTAWVNLSLSLNRVVQHNRLSAMELVQLLTSNTLNGSLPLTTRLGTATPSARMRPLESFPLPVRVLYRDAAVFGRYACGVPPRRMQLAVMQHKYPRFEHRFAKDDMAQSVTVYLPWVRVRPVSPFALR